MNFNVVITVTHQSKPPGTPSNEKDKEAYNLLREICQSLQVDLQRNEELTYNYAGKFPAFVFQIADVEEFFLSKKVTDIQSHFHLATIFQGLVSLLGTSGKYYSCRLQILK